MPFSENAKLNTVVNNIGSLTKTELDSVYKNILKAKMKSHFGFRFYGESLYVPFTGFRFSTELSIEDNIKACDIAIVERFQTLEHYKLMERAQVRFEGISIESSKEKANGSRTVTFTCSYGSHESVKALAGLTLAVNMEDEDNYETLGIENPNLPNDKEPFNIELFGSLEGMKAKLYKNKALHVSNIDVSIYNNLRTLEILAKEMNSFFTQDKHKGLR